MASPGANAAPDPTYSTPGWSAQYAARQAAGGTVVPANAWAADGRSTATKEPVSVNQVPNVNYQVGGRY